MTRKYQTFKELLLEDLQDSESAQEFLNATIEAYAESSDIPAFLLSLRYLAEAKGGVAKLAKKTKLNKQNLYKILTGKTSPKFSTIYTIIKGLGYTFKAEPITKKAATKKYTDSYSAAANPSL